MNPLSIPIDLFCKERATYRDVTQRIIRPAIDARYRIRFSYLEFFSVTNPVRSRVHKSKLNSIQYTLTMMTTRTHTEGISPTDERNYEVGQCPVQSARCLRAILPARVLREAAALLLHKWRVQRTLEFALYHVSMMIINYLIVNPFVLFALYYLFTRH